MNNDDEDDELPNSEKPDREPEKTGIKELDNKELRQFLSKKKKEEKLSNKAYELMNTASELAMSNDFNEAIDNYKKAKSIFEELKWKYEIERIDTTINELIKKKEAFLEGLEKKRKDTEQRLELERKHKKIIEEGAKRKEKVKYQERSAKLQELEKQKKKKELFQKEISDLVDKAERLAREYEIERKKKLKKGEFPEKNPYPEIIEIYETVYKKLINRGWKRQAEVYENQIKICQEKLEKDKKLHEIEAEKAEKHKHITELQKVEREPVSIKEKAAKSIEKKQEEKNFEEKIGNLVNKAERLSREYEIKLKKKLKEGEFPEQNPYPEIIEIYKTVYKKLINRGWKRQAEVYESQIKIYQEKLEKEKKLRKVEQEKAEKQKQIEEMHKIAAKELNQQQKQDIEGELKEELEDKKLENHIDEMVDKAEKMAREYEINLMKGKFEQDCPYPEIIEIYRNLREKLQKHGWYEESSLYANQIQFYKEKLQKDRKLRKIESSKASKELVSEIKKVSGKEREKSITEEAEEELKEKEEMEEFQEEVSKMVDEAEKMAREYENKLKKGDFEIENQYPEIIRIYRKIRKKLIERGWLKEADIYLNQINIYKEKAQRVEKLKKVEAEKLEREKKIEEMHKLQKPIERETKSKDETEIKKKKEREQKLNKAMSLIDEAERLVKVYESKLKTNLSEFESPYQKAIDLYKNAKDLLIEIDWDNEAARLDETIEFYLEKKEKDEKLRELEDEKKELEIPTEIEEIDVEEKTKKAFIEVQSQRQKEKKIYDEIFDIINKAEDLAKQYHKNIEKNSILDHEAPYEEVIKLYKEAKEKFKKVGWNREAEKLNESISYYSQKLEEDEILKEKERERIKRKKQEQLEQQILFEESQKEEEKLLQEQQQAILREKEAQKRFEQQKENAFNVIDKALKIARNYNNKIQEGNILDYECPYDHVIDLYREAKKIFQEIGWNNEAEKMGQSINYYKQKLEEDKKIRREEKERLKRREQELLEQQKLIEESRKEEKELLELQEKTIEQERKEKEIFERKKDQAFKLMDEAKNELVQHNFGKAINLYKETREIFKNIDWSSGIDLVEESINSIFRKKREYEREQQELMKEKEKERKLREQLEKQIEKIDKIKKLEEEEQRKELIRLQEEKRKEKEITDKAFKLLEEGTRLVENEEFDEAYQKYIEARDLFTKVDWEREVSRINSELLYNLEKEREKAEKIKETQKRRIEEEKELMELLEQEEQKRKEEKRRKIEEKRKRLIEIQRAEKPKEEVMDKLELAKLFIRNYKYNEAFIKLKEKLKEVKDDNIEEEIQDIIETVKDQTHVPLIVSMTPDLIKNDDFIDAYEALDKAEQSIKSGNYMKAISEFNEAKFNLNKIDISDKVISAIEEKIIFYKQEIGHQIVATSKEEESLDDLKSEIARRRAERRKRLKNLGKK